MLRSEILTLTTTTATKVAILVAVIGLITSQLAFTLVLPSLRESGSGGPEITGDLPVVDLGLASVQLAALNPFGPSLATGSIGVVVVAVVLLGVLAGTGEFRHGGIVGAVLAEPRRERIVLAKAGAAAVVVTAAGVLLTVVGALTLVITLLTTDTPLTVPAPDALGILVRGVAAMTLLGLVGLAAGLMLRTQLTAVLVMLAVLVLEPVLVSVAQLATGTLPAWAQLMPVGLAQAAVSHGGSFGPATAVGLLACVAAVLLCTAAVTLRRRDL